MSKTLWIWESLPKQLEEADKSWLNEGDAVENVHRIGMGKLTVTVQGSLDNLPFVWRNRWARTRDVCQNQFRLKISSNHST